MCNEKLLITFKWGQTCYGVVQFSSVAQSCLTLCDPVNRSMQYTFYKNQSGVSVGNRLDDCVRSCR